MSQILNGQQEFPLFDNWFKVSFDQVLAGYTFDPAADGSTNPTGPAYTIFDNMPGTGLDDAMPWSGMTCTLQPWVPIENWINDLQAPVGEDYFDGFDVPTLEEFGRAVQALSAAALVAFDPFTPGSPFCPGECTTFTDANADYNDLVQAINQAWPGNETIGTWLEAYDNGVANGPTEKQIQNAIHILQQGFWDFDNPNPLSGSGPDFTATSEWFYNFWTSLGFDPSNNPAPYDFSALVGAFTPEQLNGDWNASVNAFDPSQFQPTGPRW